MLFFYLVSVKITSLLPFTPFSCLVFFFFFYHHIDFLRFNGLLLESWAYGFYVFVYVNFTYSLSLEVVWYDNFNVLWVSIEIFSFGVLCVCLRKFYLLIVYVAWACPHISPICLIQFYFEVLRVSIEILSLGILCACLCKFHLLIVSVAWCFTPFLGFCLIW